MKASLSKGPFIPPDYTPADAAAVSALATGEATPDQQIRAIKWIVEQCAGTYEFHYYPSERDTSFALGRGFVGQQIVKLTRLNQMALRRAEQ